MRRHRRCPMPHGCVWVKKVWLLFTFAFYLFIFPYSILFSAPLRSPCSFHCLCALSSLFRTHTLSPILFRSLSRTHWLECLCILRISFCSVLFCVVLCVPYTFAPYCVMKSRIRNKTKSKTRWWRLQWQKKRTREEKILERNIENVWQLYNKQHIGWAKSFTTTAVYYTAWWERERENLVLLLLLLLFLHSFFVLAMVTCVNFECSVHTVYPARADRMQCIGT